MLLVGVLLLVFGLCEGGRGEAGWKAGGGLNACYDRGMIAPLGRFFFFFPVDDGAVLTQNR